MEKQNQKQNQIKGQWLNKLVTVLILFGMLAGIGGLVVIFVNFPYAARVLSGEGRPPYLAYLAGALAAVCVLGCEYIAWTLFAMMRSLSRDPFVEKNVSAFRRMGFTALGVMACGLLTLVIRPVPLAVLAALPVGMCGLFSLVLGSVFDAAVRAKQENDLTV